MRNWRAFLVYALVWSMVFGGTVLLVSVLSVLTDSDVAAVALLPATLMLATMFFCSIYDSFRDCFVTDAHYA